MPMRLLPLCVLLACASALGAADEKPAVKLDPVAVRKLVEQLGSKDFATRERATRELTNLEEAPEALREAMKSSDGPQGEPASQPTDRFMDPPFTSRAVAMPQQSAMLCRDPCQCRSDRVACHRNWAMTPALEASHTDHVSPAGGHRSTSDMATVGTLATVRRASRHRADGHPPSRPRSRAYWRYRSGDFARG